MNTADQLIAILDKGMTLIESVGAATKLGRSKTAKDLKRLHDVYFGATKYTKLQRHARGTSHTFETLVRIENKLRRLTKINKKEAWSLRAVLCHTPVAQIDEVANKKLDELCPKPGPTPGVSVRRGKGLWSISATADARTIADIWALQDGTIDTFVSSVFNGGAKPDVVNRVVMTLDERITILDGDGDDVVLQMTNGATMTGAEWIAENFHQGDVVVGLFHPLDGPVRAYEKRFANDHQRELCLMENPTCAWPGCNKPGTESQFHHIKAFIDGGLTESSNLVTLCAYHNRRNSDRGPNRNGRMARIGPATCWVSPYGRIVPTGIYAAA